MKEGSSRKKKIIGLVGLMAIVLAGISFLVIGAGFAHGNMSANAEVYEGFRSESAQVQGEQFGNDNANAAQFGENADFGRSGRDWHDHHGRHGRSHQSGFNPLGFMVGGLINLAVLGLASFGIYSLYKRWTSPAPATAQARVINEDDDDEFEQDIKVG